MIAATLIHFKVNIRLCPDRHRFLPSAPFQCPLSRDQTRLEVITSRAGEGTR